MARLSSEALSSVLIRALLALQMQTSGLVVSAPSEAPGVLMERADAATEAGEHAEAAELYGRSYRALDSGAQADATGAFVVGVAAEAHLRAFEASEDTAQLDAAEVLLGGFIGAATAAHGAEADGVAEANALLERVREQQKTVAPVPVAAPDPQPVRVAEPDPEPELETTPDPETDTPGAGPVGGDVDPTPPTDTNRPQRDALGLGLVVGGSLLAAGGIGVTIYGSRFEPYADRVLEEAGFPDGDPDAEDYRDDLRLRGQIAMVSGGVLMAAGVAGIIWGGVRLSRKKSKPGARAWLAPTRQGVVVRGRF